VTDKNILPRVPGQYVARALKELPDAETAQAEIMEATIDVPELGSVRITAKRMKHKKGKSTHSFWTADRCAIL
jgi:hypothetical protein